MEDRSASEAQRTKPQAKVERTSELDLVVTRTVNGPARLVYDAWTKADLFKRWWVPKSFGLTLLSCEMDARVGGRYRLVFPHGDSTVEFFGTYTEVVPHARLVWTNEEDDGGLTITTVTFTESAGQTVVVVHDHYPTSHALENGSTHALPESLDQLDELLGSLGSGKGTA
ncbi:MAG: SRPBCC domain-containing protein [Gemmatimonadetes bacterium]|nr:SRPBCC domain-containing protein [Gemmatimonadota bacterium]